MLTDVTVWRGTNDFRYEDSIAEWAGAWIEHGYDIRGGGDMPRLTDFTFNRGADAASPKEVTKVREVVGREYEALLTDLSGDNVFRFGVVMLIRDADLWLPDFLPDLISAAQLLDLNVALSMQFTEATEKQWNAAEEFCAWLHQLTSCDIYPGVRQGDRNSPEERVLDGLLDPECLANVMGSTVQWQAAYPGRSGALWHVLQTDIVRYLAVREGASPADFNVRESAPAYRMTEVATSRPAEQWAEALQALDIGARIAKAGHVGIEGRRGDCQRDLELARMQRLLSALPRRATEEDA